MSKKAFGIDIGGSGIKGAPVDLSTGELAADRIRIPTPQPSTPEAVADTVAELIASFDVETDMPVGVTFPAVIKAGVAQTAANVDESWIGTDVDALLTERTGHDVFVVNDADAAGIAEMKFGAGRKIPGVVQVITLGTGVGSATFVDGTLVPNTELGHLLLHGASAERYMASSIKDEQDLDWETWAGRLQEYFSHLEFLFSPTRIIVGGGVSKKHKHFLPLLDLKAEIVPAKLRNEAGIVGAAVLAHREEKALLKAEAKPEKKSAKEAEKKAAQKERAKREAAK
ncbi:MAG: polyphosphate--glucose phosphotransferase [Brachybacterium sp.]|uniref:polyphosphate--glucose phosphotransferase n=1 Tax=Brachybacterium sp. TaxID=1891286 RepID=UPI00264CAE88|nr:ROK family protein [Brachybacterium sp.]